MGTDKRERQKANRQARLAELQRQQRRSTSRRKVIRIGLIVIVALGAAFGLSRLIGQDDDTVDAADTSVPASDAATTTGAPPSTLFAGATITGETPTVVLTRLRRAVDEVRRERRAEAVQRFPDDYVPGRDAPLTARRW